MGTIKVIRASAGSGKTYRLAFEYVRGALARPDEYRRILAVTFTNKATEEMKRRILREINDLADGHTPSGSPPAFLAGLEAETGLPAGEIRARAGRLRTRVLHDYSHFTVLTIDKFFQRIIRAFLRELGLENDFTLELQTESVLGAAADRLIEQTLSEPALRRWIGRFVEEQIEAGRGWNIRREITELGRVLFTEECPVGTLAPMPRAEIGRLLAAADASVEKAAAGLRALADRAVAILRAAGLDRDDFPYGKSGFVNYFYTVAAGEPWGGYGKRVADALASDEKWVAKNSPRKADIQAVVPQLRPLLAELAELYDRHAPFARTTALVRRNARTYALLADLSEQVRAVCRERNVMPISETNRIIDRLIDGNDTPFIFEKTGGHFTRYLIDEFQDTSTSQWRNFRPLIENALAGHEGAPVLLVGDVKQSIYRWRGGDWEILGDGVARAFAGASELTLDTNYRSLVGIVRFNNELIAAAAGAEDTALNDLLDEARGAGALDEALYGRLHGMTGRAYADCRQLAARPGGEGAGHVRIVQYDRQAEGRHTARLVETVEELQRRGFRAADIALLVRYNAEAVDLAARLLEHKTAHPDSPFCYDVVTAEALTIGRSPVVGFAVAALRLAVDPRQPIPRAVFLRRLGRPVTDGLTDAEAAFLASLRLVAPEEAFERLVAEYRLDREPGQIAYVQAFADQLLAFSRSRIADLPLFLDWWDETGSAESVALPAGQDAITIITIHKAKGLQYPAVILPFASWPMTPSASTLLWAAPRSEPFGALGRLPVRFDARMAGSDFAPDYYRELVLARVDNLNTLYVALTRAEAELHLMMPRTEKHDAARVGDLVLRVIRDEGPRVRVGTLEGTATEREGDRVYEFGRPVASQARPAGDAERTIPAADYPSYAVQGRLRLRPAPDRSAPGEALSPRQYGRLMHRAMESLRSVAELAPTLDRLTAEGALSADDRRRLEGWMTGALADPLVRSWFDGGWEEVRNESDIIVPGATAGLRRPDRVMIRGGRAVAVDYKFGRREEPAHLRQMAEYLRLLRKMGYTEIQGYVWYVEQGRTVEVDFSA